MSETRVIVKFILREVVFQELSCAPSGSNPHEAILRKFASKYYQLTFPTYEAYPDQYAYQSNAT